MTKTSRIHAILAGSLLVLLIVSTVAVAIPVKFSFQERFSKLTQPSSCPTCNQCITCAAGSSYSAMRSRVIPASIHEKLSLLPSIQVINLTPAKIRTNHGWNAITNPPFGCPAGTCA